MIFVSFIVFVFIVTEIIIYVFNIPSYVLPRPTKVILNVPEMLSKHHYDFYITIVEALIGLTVAVAASIIMTYLMDRFKIIYTIFYPVFFIMQSVPVLLLAPALMIIFGFGITPKVILIAFMGFFPIMVSFIQGIKSVDENYIKFLQINKATNNQIFYHVKFKGAMSSFFAGLKMTVAYAFIGAVFAETMGGKYGIGLVIARYQKSLRATNVFTLIFLIMVISLTSYAILALIEKKILKYKEKF